MNKAQEYSGGLLHGNSSQGPHIEKISWFVLNRLEYMT